VTLTFTVFGVAQPQGSTRAFIPKGWTRPIITADNPQNKGWRQLVAEGANIAINALPADARAPIEAGVRLSASFYLPRPKSLKRGTPAAHLKAPDVDKLLRSVCDALKGVAFADDKQVVEIIGRKHYTGVDEPPHADIRVEPSILW